MTGKTEFEKAKAWRLAHEWSLDDLSQKTGYSRESIYWFERGQTPTGQAHAAWVWQRYRMTCAGVQAEMNGKFDW